MAASKKSAFYWTREEIKWGHQTSEQVVFQNGNIPSSLPSKPHNHISKFQIKHGILFQIMNCPVSWNTRQWYYFTKLF